MVDGDFERVYVVGRLLSVGMALLTVWLLFCCGGEWAGPFAAILLAVSPSHMLQSDQVRVDATLTAMLVLTLLVAIRLQSLTPAITSRAVLRDFLLLGFVGGLAVAAKYSAVTAVAAIILVALWLRRFPWRGMLGVAAGGVLGFLFTAPFITAKSPVYAATSMYSIASY